MLTKIQALNICTIFLLLYTLPAYSVLEQVATVKFSRGVVAAHQANGAPRLLGKNSEIFLNDNIQTAEKSFVILAFNDGGNITIKPNSNFSINKHISKNNVDVPFKLHQGEVKVSTENTDKTYQIKTELSTVSAAKADYSVRVCKQACPQNNKPNKQLQIIARIAKLQGKVTAQFDNAESRLLSVDDPIYSKDLIASHTSSYALLIFQDEGRITIQENTELDISQYQYQQGSVSNKAFYNLISGGLRVLTGKIGKVNKQNFKIDTPVATLGIRGTGFDLRYKNKLHSHVWQSAITQTNDAGIFDLVSPNANYILSRTSIPQPYSELPEFFKRNPAPRPDQVFLPLYKQFNEVIIDKAKNTSYVIVHTGQAKVIENKTKKSTTLSEGEILDLDTYQHIDKIPENYLLYMDNKKQCVLESPVTEDSE